MFFKKPGILSFNLCHTNQNVGSAEPGFQKIKKYFPSTKVYRKNYTFLHTTLSCTQAWVSGGGRHLKISAKKAFS